MTYIIGYELSYLIFFDNFIVFKFSKLKISLVISLYIFDLCPNIFSNPVKFTVDDGI